MKIKEFFKTLYVVTKRIIKSSFVQSTISMLMIVSCILLGGFLAIYENRTNASIIANEYFQCYLRSDFKTMYSYLDIKESDFVNYKTFKHKLKNEKTQITFEDYTVNKPVKKDGVTRVTVSYTNGYTNEDEEFVINLVARRTKAFQVFPDWKVKVDDWIIEDAQISVPSGSTLLFDSYEMSDCKTETIKNEDGTETDVDVYKVSRLFLGSHDFHIDTPFTEGSIIKDIKNSGEKVEIDSSLETLKADYNDKASEVSNEMILTFYDKAKNRNKTYKSMRKYFDKSSYDELKKAFEKIKKILFKEKLESDIDGSRYEITSLNVTDLIPEIKNFNSKGEVSITCTCTFEYTAKADATEDNTYFSSYVSEYSGVYNSRFRLNLKYDEVKETYIITGIKLKDTKVSDSTDE